MLRKVLIANRGEIAVRIIRACRERSVQSVAVYSEIDAWAPHVSMADEAYALAGNLPSQSYLDIDQLLAIARRAGCDAVHPGYGFLSERAVFARAVTQAGLVFIGPSAEAMEQLGDKVRARQAAIKQRVPVVPGLDRPLRPSENALVQAREIGFPVLLKATAGGGGKGMRVVRSAEALSEAITRASSEAQAAFGDGAMYMERYLERPRHVEVQIFADRFGSVVALGERECSIQRRHQKLIEESPCPALGAKQRKQMFDAAAAIAQAVGYLGAGTVEFLLDGKEFFFLEMNTRLQVEHPVTEMVTGLDLVQEQLTVAAGEKLSFRARDVQPRGVALECRITAEDPFSGSTFDECFMPSTGRILALREPSGPGVRVDSGVAVGDVVSPFYDPLLAKLIVWGRDREEAIRRCLRALREYRLVGVKTSIPFHAQMLAHEGFRRGAFDVNFAKREFKPEAPPKAYRRMAAIIAAMLHAEEMERATPTTDDQPSRWKSLGLRDGLRGHL